MYQSTGEKTADHVPGARTGTGTTLVTGFQDVAAFFFDNIDYIRVYLLHCYHIPFFASVIGGCPKRCICHPE
jgi:hypothetical protein